MIGGIFRLTLALAIIYVNSKMSIPITSDSVFGSDNGNEAYQ